MATLNGSSTLPRALRRARWHTSNVPKRRATTAAAVEYTEPEPYIPETLPPPTPSRVERKQAVRNAKPFSEFLTDTFQRQHDYLRISVTERCNLRCLYCMPEEGIQLSPSKELLTTAEIYYLSALFVNQGVNKIRLTGGEPTVRKDIIPLMQQIGSLRRNGLKELALTTNGISLHRKLDAMVEAGLTGVNISLDTLDPFEFQLLTRRQGFDAVMKSISRVQEMNKLGAGIKLKINAVVMRGLNDHQVMPFVEKTRDEDIEVRFIEYMPFGGNKWSEKKMLPYSEMLDMIRKQYPGIARLRDAKNDTSKTWQVPGFKGRIGFITSMTHNFCGTCNRLRITSDGNLKVCLHGESEVSLRDLLRKDHGGEPMDEEAFEAIRQLELDRRKGSPLQFDGEEGWISKEQQLLEVIGMAVKRKKAKHAGMGALENMKNRPMILIDESKRSKRTQNHSSSYLQTRSRPSVKQAWSQIPLHVLSQPSAIHSQVRNYSSNKGSRPQSNQTSLDETESVEEAEQDAESRSAFGFQSLKELFHQPERQSRYSRPNKVHIHQATSPSLEQSSIDSRSAEKEGTKVDVSFFRSSTPTNGAATSSQSPTSSPVESNTGATKINGSIADTAQSVATERKSDNAPDEPTERRTQRRLRKYVTSEPSPIRFKGTPSTPGSELFFQMAGKYTAKRYHERRRGRPNPFTNGRGQQAVQTQRVIPGEPERPWGLSPEDMKTVDSFSAPDSALSDLNGQAPGMSSAQAVQTERNNEEREKKDLTHVNPTGEAHMVDVGTKPDSRRVAIAVAFVSFGTPEPVRLIFENNNKKGDVLGVARIAGIMAAKRTSDLIPLCHPIVITKVEVDVKLEPPNTQNDLFKTPQHGGVSIRTLVECNGQTGVEMEALTAAMSAALTVHDMCKAVDRKIIVNNVRVVYKSGGRSGMHYFAFWAHFMGRDYFIERNLEVPDIPSLRDEKDSKEGEKVKKAKGSKT